MNPQNRGRFLEIIRRTFAPTPLTEDRAMLGPRGMLTRLEFERGRIPVAAFIDKFHGNRAQAVTVAKPRGDK